MMYRSTLDCVLNGEALRLVGYGFSEAEAERSITDQVISLVDSFNATYQADQIYVTDVLDGDWNTTQSEG